MDLANINRALSAGEIDQSGLFPHLDSLKRAPYIFEIDFGLKTLPTKPGILLIRGARQYGKSTWLERELRHTIEKFGAGTAYYLNGENLLDADRLEKEIDTLITAFSKKATIRRIFIDEITAIPKWEMALKRMADQGKLENILVITTGSKATDLRRGGERLPGRKGRLDRTTYLFTPVAYKEFHRQCRHVLGDNTLIAYLLSGGSPIACTELATNGMIPEFVIALVRDWIEGEIALSGRNRTSLLNIFDTIFRFGVTSVGQAKLAREAGLANNSVAAGYIEVLNDLGCIVPAYPWDFNRNLRVLRKPCKYHFTNLLAAVAYHASNMRAPNDFLLLSEIEQGIWYEWLVAQELLRRAAISGKEILAPLAFWQTKQHEIDFVVSPTELIEVKRGSVFAIDFGWFAKQLPNQQLIVINQNSFETAKIRCMTLETFLLEEG